MENAKKRKQPAVRTIEIIALAVTIASFIWMVLTMASLENPVGDPRLVRAIMITVFAACTWLFLMVMREAKQFGWWQALVSVVFFVLAQVVVYLVLRLFR